MIRKLTLNNFKGFERFQVTFGREAYLVGPNNAGKSTLISALRFAAYMVRHAKQKSPTLTVRDDDDRQLVAYSFTPGQFEILDENIRHEFRDVEARLQVVFTNRSVITAVWPLENGEPGRGGHFYLEEESGGYQPRKPAEVRKLLPTVGVVPILSPIDQEEEALTDAYVRRHLDGRLSSRHLRNQLMLLNDDLSAMGESAFVEFTEFAKPWLRELELESPERRFGEGGAYLDVFYKERGSRIPKELAWAGDGLQIWLQLLLHLFRLRQAQCVVLDEPDVYLHADLQRRLVRVLDEMPFQTITASHSSEVLAEADPESVIWIDKSRRRGVRAPSGAELEALSDQLGTHFNLPLARTLTARVVVFVEGQDMKILRLLAETLELRRLVDEDGIAVVPLRSFSNWDRVEPFAWLVEAVLPSAVKTFVLLDRDYRSDAQVRAIEGALKKAGVNAHVWDRKELESYLVIPETLVRASGVEREWIAEALGRACEELKGKVFARVLDERQRAEVSATKHRVNVTEQASKDFEEIWADRTRHLWICPPKELLASINADLQSAGKNALTTRRLAKEMLANEIPSELASVLRDIEAAC